VSIVVLKRYSHPTLEQKKNAVDMLVFNEKESTISSDMPEKLMEI